jgi:hypothetical protein
MTVPTAVRWVLLAVVGLLIAVAVAVLASELTSQRIGLASEPLDAGKILAPPQPRGGRAANTPSGDGHGGTSTASTTPTTTTATTVPTTTVPPATTQPPPVTTTGDDSSSGSDSGGEGASDDD